MRTTKGKILKLLWIVGLALAASTPAKSDPEPACSEGYCIELCTGLGCFTGYCSTVNSGCKCINCPPLGD